MASILDLAEDASDSENDVDYVPSEDEASELSLEENSDEEVVPEADSMFKGRKQKKSRKVNLRVNSNDNTPDETGEKNCVNEEDDKKRAESLWQDFLQDAAPPVRKKNTEVKAGGQDSVPSLPKKNELAVPKKVTVSEVFHFAGESVVVSKEVDQNSVEAQKVEKIGTSSSNDKQSSPVKDVKNFQSSGIKRPGGLGSVLGTIMNKKQKLSTLQKSMLDWKSFKKDEGIEEELDQHRRSKDSYVEKQAFLQRSDLRQFEVEKSIRLSSRSNR